MDKELILYQTSDIGLATAISLYFPVDSFDKSNPQKVIFNFKRHAGLDNLIQNYWSKKLLIEPQTLFSQLKSIKTRLYEPK